MIDLEKTVDIDIHGYPQQMEFLKDKSPIIAFIAGAGAGKTFISAYKTLVYCLQNPGAWGMVTAPQNSILDIATIPTYEKIFPPTLIKHRRSRPHPEWTLTNGCRIFFWSTNKPDTIAGSELAFAHMDEGSLSPYQAYVNLKKRLRQTKRNGEPYPYQVWISTTPRQLNWLYMEITDKIDPIRMIQAKTNDNIYIDAEAYIERMGLTGKEYEQEILGMFVSLTGECLFDGETLSRSLREVIAPIEVRNNGLIQIWREPVVGVEYIAGADCADEGGEGINDLVILDKQTGMEMAELSGDISADRFADMVFTLCEEYSNPLLGVERNGTAGGMVIQKLTDMGYPNLYRDDKGRSGWYTTTNAIPPKVDRHRMLLEYEEAVRLRRTVVLSSDAVGEMSTFVRDQGGKYKHRQGAYDDRIMARAIAWQMRKAKSRLEKDGFKAFQRSNTSYNMRLAPSYLEPIFRR